MIADWLGGRNCTGFLDEWRLKKCDACDAVTVVTTEVLNMQMRQIDAAENMRTSAVTDFLKHVERVSGSKVVKRFRKRAFLSRRVPSEGLEVKGTVPEDT